MEEIFSLWEGLERFPAGKTEEALAWFAGNLRKLFRADNIRWIAGVRVLRGAPALKDRLLGWRLRANYGLVPLPPDYQKLTAWFHQHYDKLTSDFPIGHATPALIAGFGKLQSHRMRDGWIPFREFRRSEHYRLHYTALNITDRIWLSFPLSHSAESIFLLDRMGSSVHFSGKEADLAALAIRGIRTFHRRLFLMYGLLVANEPISPAARHILLKLLTGMSEKEIAESMKQTLPTTHKYVTSIYRHFGVNGRAALMSLWLGS